MSELIKALLNLPSDMLALYIIGTAFLIWFAISSCIPSTKETRGKHPSKASEKKEDENCKEYTVTITIED